MRLYAMCFFLAVAAGLASVFPMSEEAVPPRRMDWQQVFSAEFNNPSDLAGWSVDHGDGRYWIDVTNGFLHLETRWGYAFPLIWRNGLFSNVHLSRQAFAIEVRARRPLLTEYGNAIGVGTTVTWDARYAPTSLGPILANENVLMNEQHALISGVSGHERACLHQPGKPFTPDNQWHVGRVEFGEGMVTHYFDGVLVQTMPCVLRPASMYFGNAYTQTYPATWSALDVDYVRIYIRPMPPTPSGFLPLLQQ
jgi:hypothetical protein